jgi:hypothetical protein
MEAEFIGQRFKSTHRLEERLTGTTVDDENISPFPDCEVSELDTRFNKPYLTLGWPVRRLERCSHFPYHAGFV